MRETITPKKRFQVLDRDNFRCRYCGCDSTTTVLEVDHIVPVKAGGTNKIDNLLTSCHRCNRGKGSRNLGDKTDSYKIKIADAIREAKSLFYKKWNSNIMGTIDQKTQSLLSIYISSIFNDYASFLDSVGTCSYHKYQSQRHGFSYEQAEKEFENGGEYCEDVLKAASAYFIEDISSIIKEVFDNNRREWDSDTDYASKLNYHLTSIMSDEYKDQRKLYVLHKFTLHKNLLDEIQ